MKSLVILGLSAAVSFATASETPSIGTQGASDIATPRSGQSKETVRETFGEPAQRVPAVGEPPISRWQYQDFTVYFEYDHVIHAVKHRT